MSERWLPVVGLEDRFEVSDLGRVRSLATGRIRKPSPGNKYGHLYVSFKQDGKGCVQPVHKMVLETFVGPRPADKVCCHTNGDRTDNRLENLRWDTQSSNVLDAVNGGTHYWAKRTHCKHGHEYTPENTSIGHRDGKYWRVCRQCERNRQRTLRQKVAV